jgi:hypothetical protein
MVDSGSGWTSRMGIRCLLFVIVASPLASAQGSSSECNSYSCQITLTFGAAGIQNSAIAAYSGQQSRKYVQILGDGTRMTIPSPFLSKQIYRDSQGRIRAERPMFPHRPGAKPPMDVSLVEIQDPQAGYLYILDSFHHFAYRIQVHASQSVARRVFADDTPGTPGGNVTGETEPLGTRLISGVMLSGLKITSLEPSDGIVEIWIDPQTNVEVLRKFTRPSAELTIEVQNYSNAEPDSALFLVPPSYQVVDASGPLTIEIPRLH